jgi:predicted aldo/keto reductase-like oxidoreductase
MTALKFLLGDKNVEVVISGMRSVSEVVENIAVTSGTYALTNTELGLVETN